ncbi:hypothetical protein L1787_07450 [Acuticoccus sp. M5D2P5]|uniref:hypothetical protein n=1 Tax=Acuticoccus kalidii TaxID=2910977 RepID=UPI001F44887F|nr:hypothetical protein [Acuticoccus kalidii]MCF3933245.1 hypothetical protein [Acuticoccus kalidii]
MSDLADLTMVREVVAHLGERNVVALDTIAHVAPQDEGQIIATGSHGGLSSGEYAARVALAAVFFNDAGRGKDDAGIAGLALLDEAGIPAGAVAHESAVIGVGGETYHHGVISALNARAEAAGYRIGEPLKAAIARLEKGASC